MKNANKKVLIVHNFYQLRGGEDQVFEDLCDLLTANGFSIDTYTLNNNSIKNSFFGKLAAASKVVWNQKSYREIIKLISSFKPDLIHIINTFPMLSFSVFYAAKKMGVPVVFQVGNYRLGCANATLLRNEKICRLCVDKTFPISAVRYKCYRKSFFGSAVVASMIAIHRTMKSINRTVDAVLVPSNVTKEILSEMAVDSTKVIRHPHSLAQDPGLFSGKGGYAAFVGRLSGEKGIKLLLAAWETDKTLPDLKIVGDGELIGLVREASSRDSRIHYLGQMPLQKVYKVLGDAVCLVMPSIWQEPFGRTNIESLATGTPVIGAKIGAIAEIIRDGVNGFHFEPGNHFDLASKVHKLFSLAGQDLERMRHGARDSYLEKYTRNVEFEHLIRVYNRVLQHYSKRFF